MTNEITWTSEDVQLVEKFIEIRNKGYYVSGEQLTEAYNRILHKNVNVTQCGSCLRQRVNELEGALQQFKKSIELDSKASESVSKEGVDNTKVEDKKPVRKAKK